MVEGSGAMTEIQQGTGIEVGREGSGVGSGRWAKQKKWIGTEDTIDGCMAELPFAVECCLEGRWDWLCMAVVMDIVVDGEDRVVLELNVGLVHVVLQQVLKQEEQHSPVRGTAEIHVDLLLELD